MRTRWKITAVGLVLLAGIAGAFFLLEPPEPHFRGRGISAWLDDWAADRRTDAYLAVAAVGTNALPYAVRNLARNDAFWDRKYREYQPRLPSWMKKVFRDPKPLLEVVHGANVFHYTGTNSLSAAIELLEHESSTVRQAAAWGLASLRRQTEAANRAIPALTRVLSDPDERVRMYALIAMVEMGPAASNAVPSVTSILAGTNGAPAYLRAGAARVLGKIGPDAASAIPELHRAIGDTNVYLRGQAAAALWRVNGDVNTALPALLGVLPREDEHAKWDWIIALGEMGPQAHSAIPELLRERETVQAEWVRLYVVEAINKIDPDGTLQAQHR